MADSIEIGLKPGRITVHLRARGDFVAGLDAITAEGADRDWPPGTQFDLCFYESASEAEPAITWPATVTDGRAAWYIPRAQIRADVITPNRKDVALIYTSEDGVILDVEEGTARWT